MASTSSLKGRIKSVRNTRQITKAMEVVSASKMRRAQEAANASREYRNLATSILDRLRQVTDVSRHPLFAERPVQTKIYIVATSDSGLAGAYNSNLLKRTVTLVSQDHAAGIKTKCIVIGRRGAQFLAKINEVEVLASYERFPDNLTANDIRPILTTVTGMYERLEVDAVEVIYTEYRSSISQVVVDKPLLPAASVSEPLPLERPDVLIEPSVDALLTEAADRLLEVQLWQALRESKASEHSMRMLAMKNATDNANDIIEDLTLMFNTARQAAITQELAEITGGAEAIK